jgi:hypothetical protein
MAHGGGKGRRLDAHLHIWAPLGSKEFPFYGPIKGVLPGNEPPIPGEVEVLLPEMQVIPPSFSPLLVGHPFSRVPFVGDAWRPSPGS